MTTIKIQCVCGQKYAFDANVADSIPEENIRCPACGSDGTRAARNLQPAH